KGQIIYYAQDDEVSFERAAELLLRLKAALDEADIPFYAVNFILEKPRTDDSMRINDEETIYTANFLYTDIKEKGLAAHIEKVHHELMDYYEEQDAKTREMEIENK